MNAIPLPKVAWTMTIADVASQMHDSYTYCKLVEQWGRTTLKEMGPLVKSSVKSAVDPEW